MPVFSRHWLPDDQSENAPDDLRLKGPVLQVEIAVPKNLATLFQAQGAPIPPPVSGWALIDTGASMTGVDKNVFSKLGVNQIGAIPVKTPSGDDIHPLFPCQIIFPGTPIPDLDFNEVIGSKLEAQGYIALIGRDILRKFLLVYNGVDGTWTLAF